MAATGVKAKATLEKQRKLAIVNEMRNKGFTKSEIALKMEIPEGSVDAYCDELRKKERELAETLDPKLLAEKKADIIAGLEHDLKIASAELAKSRKGQSRLVVNKAGEPVLDTRGRRQYDKIKNEMAVVKLIQTCADIRMKIANLYGLTQVEMTVTGRIKHTFDVVSRMPAPSAQVHELIEMPLTSDN